MSLIVIVSLVSCETSYQTTSNQTITTYKFKKAGVEYKATRTYIYKVDTLKNN
jgi:uncharacterized lipoprotein YehR (DUF1307 family)